MTAEHVQIRVYGNAAQPTLIYLPGLHGDWTLVTGFRLELAGKARFVEVNYPRTTAWSLADYATGVLNGLAAHHIHRGWLLAESFSSQVAWAILELATHSGFNIEGIILAGGFVRYAARGRIARAQRLNRLLPLWLLKAGCKLFTLYARVRHGGAQETLAALDEFGRRRAEEADRQAICHRYGLILRNDPSAIARRCPVPVYQLSGFLDLVVPWLPVRRWLKRHCPACRGWKLIWRADHNVLGSAPKESADQILNWVAATSPSPALTPAVAV